MNSPHSGIPHPTKWETVIYYLLISIILGGSVYFLVQGLTQFWK